MKNIPAGTELVYDYQYEDDPDVHRGRSALLRVPLRRAEVPRHHREDAEAACKP